MWWKSRNHSMFQGGSYVSSRLGTSMEFFEHKYAQLLILVSDVCLYICLCACLQIVSTDVGCFILRLNFSTSVGVSVFFSVCQFVCLCLYQSTSQSIESISQYLHSVVLSSPLIPSVYDMTTTCPYEMISLFYSIFW